MPVRNLDVVTVHQDIISFSLVFSFKNAILLYGHQASSNIVCVSFRSAAVNRQFLLQ